MPPHHYILTSIGTDGDVFPFLGLGATLRGRGHRVTLVASEALVEDPIAFSFGPDGKLWVVEMGDYPLGLDGKGKGGG